MEHDNNISFSVGFEYPEETSEQGVEERAEEIANEKLSLMLNKIISYVLPSNNPRASLAALAHSAGVDLSYILNCENSESAIAKQLGISKQSMSLEVKAAIKTFGIQHSSTIKTGATKESYANNTTRQKFI